MRAEIRTIPKLLPSGVGRPRYGIGVRLLPHRFRSWATRAALRSGSALPPDDLANVAATTATVHAGAMPATFPSVSL